MDPGAPLVEFDITTAAQDATGTAGYLGIMAQLPQAVQRARRHISGRRCEVKLAARDNLGKLPVGIIQSLKGPPACEKSSSLLRVWQGLRS
jgi:hypothetical protein